MAIDIEALGLPFIPGADTGLYELPDDQSERIARYLGALFAAKAAGVLGQEIRHPQAYVNKVVAQRVTDARAGGKAWQDRCAEMDRDESSWSVRVADHALRRKGRDLATSGNTRDDEALAIAQRVHELAPETLRRLGERELEVFDEDQQRTFTLTGGRIDPREASLRARIFRRLQASSSTYPRARQLFADLPAGAREAAIALSLWDELGLPEQAILYGPWAEVIDGDPTVIAEAWSEAADRIRLQWRDLPEAAFGWSLERQQDSF